MHKMNNLEYFFLVDELARQLAGKRFGRIRKLKEGVYRMKIGPLEIICEPGVRIHITKYIEAAEQSDKFIDKINKDLDNARLIGIRQINNDRIVSFDFELKAAPGTGNSASLVFEMFGEGNSILVRDGKIVSAAKYETWSDREIKAGSGYRPPKTAPSDKLEITDKYIIVSLMKLPLGKEYALEALARCGIDEKTPGKSLSGNKLLELERAINGLKAGARPYAFGMEGKIADFALAKLEKYKNMEIRESASLSDAADEYYSKLETPNPKLEKLLERLEKQKERLNALAEEERSLRSAGDYVYEHYQEAERIIQMAKEGKFSELESVYKGKVDKKEKSVEADF
jgi:predicted ribosome quality control (RQC) complex YloA/Tae2 family protein